MVIYVYSFINDFFDKLFILQNLFAKLFIYKIYIIYKIRIEVVV